MSYNKCPYDLDIELWQLVCDEMAFKDQNYLLSCDRDLWHLLRIYKLPQNYGKLMTDYILASDNRYYNFKCANFNNYNWKQKIIITDEGLKYLKKCNHT